MKVSIIITARNEEKYLPMLFEDILNQTYPLQNIEVVLMDSNSMDNTRKLMEEFKHEFDQHGIKFSRINLMHPTN